MSDLIDVNYDDLIPNNVGLNRPAAAAGIGEAGTRAASTGGTGGARRASSRASSTCAPRSASSPRAGRNSAM